MKTFILTLTLSFIITAAFSQAPVVPDFADPAVKTFYQAYTDHLIKCVQAIREKNEAKVTALFKNPGEKLVTKEKELAKELVKNPVEKQKYLALSKQLYPYVKEVQQSVYYKKMYGK